LAEYELVMGGLTLSTELLISSFELPPPKAEGFNGIARIIWLLSMSFRGANLFSYTVKLCGDEESHHNEYEILLKKEF